MSKADFEDLKDRLSIYMDSEESDTDEETKELVRKLKEVKKKEKVMKNKKRKVELRQEIEKRMKELEELEELELKGASKPKKEKSGKKVEQSKKAKVKQRKDKEKGQETDKGKGKDKDKDKGLVKDSKGDELSNLNIKHLRKDTKTKKIVDKHMKQMLATESNSESDSSISSSFSSDSIVVRVVVPKSTPGERRVILDLSFPSENCINAGIDKDIYLGESVNLTYPSVDDFVNLIKLKGRNCGIFKRDLKRAYRQIPIDPGDINFVGFHWKNHIFVDRVLSMGLRSSAHICQRVTSSVVYMMKQSGYLLLNYLDDFAGAEKSEDANVVFDLLGRLLDSCGLEESVEKASSPSTVMTFLGVKFDTSELTISVTTERVEEILLLVKTWLNLLVATVKQLQSLLGKLHFVSNCVRPGRLFVSRLLTWLRSLPDDKCDHIIPLYIRKDLFWWYHFLKSYNGVSMMALEDWSQPDEILETDATLSGCGGWFLEKREFFHVQFPSFLMDLNLHINQFELIALMICVKVWSVHFVNRKILVRCDNQSTVLVLNSGCTRDAYMQCCLREILFYAAKYNFEIKAVHFPGVENRTADILSRWHSDSRFEDLFYELPVVRLGKGLFSVSIVHTVGCGFFSYEILFLVWRKVYVQG
ncbi:Hypothetical predicted protein [Mytilus galloprovincialis]|uniref:Reverse transcriptase domain-containing protein n=1 Tax=Mytilus galloprovincialis TaxID=29158 RepID=A0A8B6C5I7_MYTGA|nr:Hypothetical predicted protein [Mytilus galloprovincialis]